MKKTMLLLAVSCLLMVSCGPKAGTTEEATTVDTCVVEEEAECCEEECTLTDEEKAMFETYKNFDALATDEERVAVLDLVKAFIDAKCPVEPCGEECEMTEEQKAEKAAFVASWADFANLEMAAKKEMLDKVLACKHNAKKEACCGSENCEKECEKDCAEKCTEEVAE